MELLKFIAEEFLHIEPKAYLFAVGLGFFTSAALHQGWRGLGWLQSWPAGVFVPLPARLGAAPRLLHAVGES